MKIINRLELYSELLKTKGKIFTVGFTKKDGSYRIMNCRTGVKKGVKGVGMAYTPIEKLLFCVYDMQKKDFRMINLNTVDRAKIGKDEYHVL